MDTSSASASRPPLSAADSTSDARSRILTAARGRFAIGGYNGTALRAIASDAGVDLALISYYFTNKANLYLESVSETLAPFESLRAVIDSRRDEAGAIVVGLLFDVFEDPERSGPATSLIRTILTPNFPDDAVHDRVTDAVRDRLAEVIGGTDRDPRYFAFAATMLGVVVMRYVAPSEPLASTPVEVLTANLSAVLQKILDENDVAA